MMKLLTSLLSRLDVSSLKFKTKKKNKETEKPSLLKDVIENPESFKLEAFIENDEIVVKIRKKEES